MRRISAALGTLAIVAGAFTLGWGTARAVTTTLYVSPGGTDTGNCQRRSMPCKTVQYAVNEASTGDTISLDEGTYVEQVTIPGTNPLTSLTLRGHGGDDSLRGHSGGDSVIQAPATLTAEPTITDIPTYEVVTIKDGVNVSASQLMVAGPGSSGCNSISTGIAVIGGATLNLSQATVTDIQDTPFSGCQNGDGIRVGTARYSALPMVGHATISGVTVTEYQKSGIGFAGTGSTGTVSDSTVKGAGATNVISQNGIEVVDGAVVTVDDNTVFANSYTGVDGSCLAPCSEDAGILPYGAGSGTVIERNSLFANDNAVEAYGDPALSGLSLQNNRISDSVADGVYFDTSTSGNTISNNDISQSDSGGATVYCADYGCYDAEDASTGTATAGTANTWENNRCQTSDPAGLCQPENHAPGHHHHHGTHP